MRPGAGGRQSHVGPRLKWGSLKGILRTFPTKRCWEKKNSPLVCMETRAGGKRATLKSQSRGNARLHEGKDVLGGDPWEQINIEKSPSIVGEQEHRHLAEKVRQGREAKKGEGGGPGAPHVA